MASVHELCDLKVMEDGGVRPVLDDPSCARTPGDLPEAAVELHWFESALAAAAFVLGVRCAGSNAVSAERGDGEIACLVALVRSDRSPPPGETLDEVVALRCHGDSLDALGLARRKRACRHLLSESKRMGRHPEKVGLVPWIGVELRPNTTKARLEGLREPMYVEPVGDDVYRVTTCNWRDREAFDGRMGRFEETEPDVAAALARFGARFVPEEYSTPATVQLQVDLPQEGFGERFVALDELLTVLGDEAEQRRRSHEIARIRSDPYTARIAGMINAGGTIDKRGARHVVVAVGDEARISRNQFDRMQAAAMIPRDLCWPAAQRMPRPGG